MQILVFILATISSVSAGGSCPEADEYPETNSYQIVDYVVINNCAIPVVKPTL